MIITQEEKDRIKSLSYTQILTEWGKLKHGERYVRCELPDNQPFTLIVHKDDRGDEIEEGHSFFNLADEYIIWLGEHKSEDGKVLTDEELEKSMRGKTVGELADSFAHDRRADGSILKKSISPNRERMLTVQKLIDYLKTQNPNACIMAYEPNSFAYVEQWPDLPNGYIRTVKEDMDDRRDFYLNQWYKDSEDKEKRCEEDIVEMYRYCKDDDIIIKF